MPRPIGRLFTKYDAHDYFSALAKAIHLLDKTVEAIKDYGEEDIDNLEQASQILEDLHANGEEAKRMIIEFLTTRRLRQ